MMMKQGRANRMQSSNLTSTDEEESIDVYEILTYGFESRRNMATWRSTNAYQGSAGS